jgi:predicted CXXCH cytochrome family protein
MAPRRAIRTVLALAALAGVVTLLVLARPKRAPLPAADAATFAGSARCAGCHAPEHAAWATSQHAMAMQVAHRGTVLGRFDGVRLTHDGLTSTFVRRGDRYVVNTEGADGRLQDFEVRFTFGVFPLQQYLVGLPGGRLQPLPLAWDARPATDGGQRWISLDAVPRHAPADDLHWTGRLLSWNYMCADCHATGVRKGYDAGRDLFRTTYAERGVACEACHGPGTRHVASASRPAWLRRITRSVDVPPARLTERRGVRWSTDSTGRIVRRSDPRTSEREIGVCAQCHARRSHIAEGYTAGAPFLDYYDPMLLVAGLYYPDGQQREEVYDHASFLQSRMYAAGVTCADCHEPHTQRLRRPGNQVCARCHAAARYDTDAHHFHAPRSAGASCASCHMPATTYMQVDPRHDHSIRVPRPDLSLRLGVPNACNRCHTDRDARWAAERVRTWYGHTPAGFQRFAGAFAADDRRDAAAADSLRVVAEDRTQPAIARASALARLAAHPGPVAFAAAERGARDADPLVRRAALDILDGIAPPARIAVAAPLLADGTRIVRLQAAWALAPVADSLPTPAWRRDFARAAAEFVESQRYNADRTQRRLTLGAFYAARRQLDSAATEFRVAMRLSPRDEVAYLNLAAILVERRRHAEAEGVLREGLARIPESAALAYERAVALASLGRTGEALRALATLRARHPLDRDVQRAVAELDALLRRPR